MKKSYHFYAIITIIFWALGFVFTRLALQYFDAYSLSFLRYFSASITLIICTYFIKINKPKKEDLITFFLAGCSGFFMYVILFNNGTALVSAATSSIVIAMVPVITALLASYIYNENLNLYQWFAIVIEFVGILVLTLMNDSFSINKGILILLVAAVCLASYNILQRKITKKYSALQSSTYSIFFGTLMLCIFLPKSFIRLSSAPPIYIIYVLILGIFSSAIAYISWSKAISLAEKTTYVSNYMFITPFLTTILGFIMIKEIPDKSTILGGIIILSGVFIFNKEGFLDFFKSKNININSSEDDNTTKDKT